MLHPQPARRRVARFGAAALCAASLTFAQAAPAAAASHTAPFSFKYRLETNTWDQNRGRTTFAIRDCDEPNETMTVNLVRSRVGSDTRLGTVTMKCAKGGRANFDAPDAGTYYFILSKLDDDKFFIGSATISYTA
ncbi:hypothetical protein ACFT7S_20285 [Streptomyces sp. NPDC057136]|uniref:hypothetical protein n=1 Tax=Streptomyces sp. NPDC057136 TaxID=3346029 RepID=UPI00362B3BF6